MGTFDIIENLVTERGITGAELSREIGMSNAVYSQWKKGLQNPSNRALRKIAEYFNVSVEYLMTGTEKSPSDETKGRGILLSDKEREIIFAYREDRQIKEMYDAALKLHKESAKKKDHPEQPE